MIFPKIKAPSVFASRNYWLVEKITNMYIGKLSIIIIKLMQAIYHVFISKSL